MNPHTRFGTNAYPDRVSRADDTVKTVCTTRSDEWRRFADLIYLEREAVAAGDVVRARGLRSERVEVRDRLLGAPPYATR